LADSHEQLIQQQEHLAITNTHLQEEIEQRERVVAGLERCRQTLMLVPSWHSRWPRPGRFR
jgi:hypothetical protein